MNLYDDIIDLPHPDPRNHPRMPREARAAQFAAFSALQGYDASIAEAARYTENQPILEDDAVEALNERLLELKDRLANEPMVTVTYFEQDNKKLGGAYRTHTGRVKKIDEIYREIIFVDGLVISFGLLLDMEILKEKEGS